MIDRQFTLSDWTLFTCHAWWDEALQSEGLLLVSQIVFSSERLLKKGL
jgi:hypothetical protein